jgi:membrane protein YqaA with SNARE-associated domain
MRHTAFCLLGVVCGYVLAAVAGHALVNRASPNTHDRSVEAAMTGAFVSGPLGAILGGVTGFLLGGRARRRD